MLELTIIGNAGQVRLHATETVKVLSISIASTRKAADNKSYTDWVQGKVWGERALALEPHISKGQRLLLRGRPEAAAYLDKDGNPAAGLVLHVRDLEFVGARPADGESPSPPPKPPKRRSAKTT
jgi:single-strand DNA-binding protein